MRQSVHTTVLLEETVAALNPQPGKTYADATLGGGGHSALLSRSLDASNDLIGIDQDAHALALARERLQDCPATLTLIQGNFGKLHSLLIAHGYPRIDGGIMLDLGVSDMQLSQPERGFSFSHPGPLDMRMNAQGDLTAEEIVNHWPQADIANLLHRNADERLSRQIASAIVQARPLKTTHDLARIAESVYRKKGVQAKNIHPATRTFQALRMAVNREVEMLTACLEQLPRILLPGARAAIITFHSIEDRLVKQAFRLGSATCLCPPQQPICTCTHQAIYKLIGKPVTASATEVDASPKSRSAKLRVVERI